MVFVKDADRIVTMDTEFTMVWNNAMLGYSWTEIDQMLLEVCYNMKI